MKYFIAAILAIGLTTYGAISYSRSTEISDKINIIRIKESCVDIFTNFKENSENVQIIVAKISKDDALESELGRFTQIKSSQSTIDIVKGLVEDHYKTGKSMSRVTIYTESGLSCHYTGYNFDQMKFENLVIRQKSYNSSELYKISILENIEIKNNTSNLSLSETTVIEQLRYLKLLFS